ncbi:MAG: anti-sigma factor [Actinomycetota bacterium]|nr:anti-sigma factor [Actinomycetota bacterium]
MTREHALIDELMAMRALDGLDDDDATRLERELAAHGDCDECRRLEAEHSEVAGMLALALDPLPVDEEMVDRILVRTQRPSAAAARVDEVSARREARLRLWQAAFGVAAAVALVLAVVLAARPDGGLDVPGERIVPFEGAPGELALAYTPGERGVLVWGTGLPDPGKRRLYELWLIDDGDAVRAACLAPTDGAVAAYVDADLSSTDLMAVTIESTDCPADPTTDPRFTAELV